MKLLRKDRRKQELHYGSFPAYMHPTAKASIGKRTALGLRQAALMVPSPTL